ncbi:MAG: hypothetical protein WCT49_02765 [Candidatus Paceibacterota bacterium]|jgi:hypothetical protein|nr:hypothetical protein [Candidatus Paceibacterota bacterium]
MTPHNDPSQTNNDSWLKKIIGFVRELSWDKTRGKISSFLTLPKKRPHGLVIYASFVLFLLIKLYPSGDGGNTGGLVLSFFAAIGLIIAVIGIFLVVKAWQKRKRSSSSKSKDVVKDKPKKPPPQDSRLTFWVDPSTWVMFLFGYLFFTTAWANDLFVGPYRGSIVDMLTMVPPADGMLYLPLFGLLIVSLLCPFLLLVERSYFLDWIGGFIFPIIFSVWAAWNLWFMPFRSPHAVRIPALEWISDWIPGVSSSFIFPADPQIPTWSIFLVFIMLMMIVPVLPAIRYYYNITYLRGMILTVMTIMFGQQVLIFMGQAFF